MTEYLLIIIAYLNNIIIYNYLYSLLLYFIISICFFSFSLPGGLILLLGSGFFFGLIEGFIINILSVSFGSLFFIYLSKTLFINLFEKYYLKLSNTISPYLKNSSLEYLILIRLIIGPPLVVQNISISLLDISRTKILFSTIIGFTPQMFLFAYLGNYTSSLIELKNFTLSQIFSYEVIIILSFLIFLILLRIFFKK